MSQIQDEAYTELCEENEQLKRKQKMSEEEIMGILKMIQERQSLIVDMLNRMESRQMEVKKEIEAKVVEGSFGARDE